MSGPGFPFPPISLTHKNEINFNALAKPDQVRQGNQQTHNEDNPKLSTQTGEIKNPVKVIYSTENKKIDLNVSHDKIVNIANNISKNPDFKLSKEIALDTTTGIVKPSFLPPVKNEQPLNVDDLIARLAKKDSPTGTRMIIKTELDGASTKQLKNALNALEDKIVGGDSSPHTKELVSLIEKELDNRKKADPGFTTITETIPSTPRKPLDTGRFVETLSKAQWSNPSGEIPDKIKSAVKAELSDAPSWQLKESLQSLKEQLKGDFPKHQVGGIRELISLMESELNTRKVEMGK